MERIKGLLIVLLILLSPLLCFADGNDKLTYLLLHGNGSDASTDISDSSSNHFTISINADAQIDTAQYRVINSSDGEVGSIYFDGTDDYISWAGGNWENGTGNTLDFWIRPATSTQTGGVMSHWYSDNACWDLYLDSGIVTFRKMYVGTENVTMTSSTGLVANTWYHVAVVKNETGWWLFIDGTIEDTDSNTDNWQGYASATRIGVGQFFTLTNFNGWIDEVRCSSGAGVNISTGDGNNVYYRYLAARWTENFIPSIYEYNGGIKSFISININ